MICIVCYSCQVEHLICHDYQNWGLLWNTTKFHSLWMKTNYTVFYGFKLLIEIHCFIILFVCFQAVPYSRDFKRKYDYFRSKLRKPVCTYFENWYIFYDKDYIWPSYIVVIHSFYLIYLLNCDITLYAKLMVVFLNFIEKMTHISNC